MNKDFHLYGTYMAAREAGYAHERAAEIAYAAQMVDDFDDELSKENHTVTGMITKAVKAAFKNSDKLDISDTWMPFHFIPKNMYVESGRIFDRFACGYGDPIKNITESLNDASSLQRIGITMHVLADSFSHQDFCGVTCKDVDIIENIRIDMNGEIIGLANGDHVPVGPSPIIPTVAYFGHGCAGHVPDLSWFKYDYRWKNSKQPGTRDNPAVFTLAYKAMTDAMKKIRNDADLLHPDSVYNNLHGYLNESNIDLQIDVGNVIRRNKAIQEAKRQIDAELNAPPYDISSLAKRNIVLGKFKDKEIKYKHKYKTGNMNELSAKIVDLAKEATQEIELDESIDCLFQKTCDAKFRNANELNTGYNSRLNTFKHNPVSRVDFDKAAKEHKDAVYRAIGITKDRLKEIIENNYK